MSNQRFSITPAAAATDSRLTDSVYRTLAVIGMYGDKNGWCWPSQSTLANLRGVSRRTIVTHIKELTDFGYLNIAPRYDKETGAQRSNMMQIRFDYVAPGFTGGVKSKASQGVGSPRLHRGGEALDFTHNAPLERPKITPHYNNIYIEPDPPEIVEIKTALSKTTKTSQEFEPEQYEKAACALFGYDATPKQIEGFMAWWQANGNYTGKPALKSLVNNWTSYREGLTVKPKSNGTAKQAEKLTPEQRTAAAMARLGIKQ